MITKTVAKAPDLQTRRVLDALDWRDKRDQHPQKRQHIRVPCRALISVYVYDCRFQVGAPANKDLFLRAWTRNISLGGLAFVYPEKLEMNEIVVYLRNDTAKIPAFLKAQVVRSCLVLDGFWEHDVQFVNRLTIAENYTALAQDTAPRDGATMRHE